MAAAPRLLLLLLQSSSDIQNCSVEIGVFNAKKVHLFRVVRDIRQAASYCILDYSIYVLHAELSGVVLEVHRL
jgi:hypothetical protein